MFKKAVGMCLLAGLLGVPLANAAVPNTGLTRQQVINKKLKEGTITKQQALLYKVQAIHNPELLPTELRLLKNEPKRSLTSLYQEVFKAKHSKDLDEEIRHYLDEIEGRPHSAGYFDSKKYPLRLHYTDESLKETAKIALSYVENAWKVETDLGFKSPPYDNFDGNNSDGSNNTNNYYDVYIHGDAAGALGYTMPEDFVPGSTIAACYSHIVVMYLTDPQEGYSQVVDEFEQTLGHELNHAMQMAYDCYEATAFFENTANLIEHLAYPGFDGYVGYIPAFQQRPGWSIDHFEQDDTYQYGGSLVPMLLDELYGNGDGKLVPEIWKRSEQEIPEDDYISYDYNEPDYLDAIESILAEKNATLDDFLVKLTEWRFFTGDRDDGKHYAAASSWPSTNDSDNCDVYIENEYDLELGQQIKGNYKDLEQLSSSYVKLNLPEGVRGSLSIHVEGDDDNRWRGQLFCQNTQGNWSIAPMTAQDDQNGKIEIDVPNMEQCVLAVSSLGDGEYDPDYYDYYKYYPSNFKYTVSLSKMVGQEESTDTDVENEKDNNTDSESSGSTGGSNNTAEKAKKRGCNAMSPVEEQANMMWFIFMTLILGGCFSIRKRQAKDPN